METTVQNKRISTSDLTKMALCVALLAVSGFVQVPLPFTPVPVTLQTLMVNLVALILMPRQAVYTMGAFLLLGLVGVPVFGGQGGIGVFAGPTGGYLIGFLIGAGLMSLLYHRILKDRLPTVLRGVLVTVVIGMPVIYLFGASWMSVVMGMDVRAALLSSVVPYLAGDVLKAVAAVAVAVPLNHALRRRFA